MPPDPKAALGTHAEFRRACESLLDRVCMAAGLMNVDGQPIEVEGPSHLKLIDVGLGCGDQTLRLFQLRRKANSGTQQRSVHSHAGQTVTGRLLDEYIGVTIAQAQADYAQRRVMRHLESLESPVETVVDPSSCTFYCADAAKPATWCRDMYRAMMPSSDDTTSQVTWLLALDCLYHFKPSRFQLLSSAYADFHASLMAFDLLLSSEPTSFTNRLLLRLVALFGNTPYSNFLTASEYKAQLVAAGYSPESIEIQDVSSKVFPGLESYIKRRETELRSYGLSLGKYKAAGWMAGWWARTGIVRGCIVIARR